MECLAATDVMRRCDLTVTLASMGEELLVTGSHGIRVMTDEMFNEESCLQADMIFLPGGMPGTQHLKEHEGLKRCLLSFAENPEKRLAAICAAPTVLGELGLLKGKKAICFPGCEEGLPGALVQTGVKVVTDGNVTTGRGLGTALDLGLEIVRLYQGEEASEQCRKQIQYA